MSDEFDPRDLGEEETLDETDLDEGEDESGIKKGKKDFEDEDSLDDLAEEEDLDEEPYDDQDHI